MGATYTRAGTKSGELRAARLQAAKRISAVAQNRRADFVVIAGDLFDDNDVDDSIVVQTVDILDSFSPIPVFVIPGNHDHMGPGSIWERRSWKRAGPHVRLLDRSEEVAFNAGTALYPCPIGQKRSMRDPTNWIPPRAEGDRRVRIGIAHGSMDALPGEVNFPIASDRVESSGLDYLALGDWHGRRVSGRWAYPGTPEQTKFGETDAGNVLIVGVSGMGEVPVIEQVRSGTLRWLDLQAEIREEQDVESLERKTLLEEMGSCLFRIRPDIGTGISHEALERLELLRRRIAASSLYLDWPEDSLRPSSIDGGELPHGLISEVDAALEQMATRQGGGGGDDFQAEAEAVREARYLLREYLRRFA